MWHDENEWLSLLCFLNLVVPYCTPCIHLSFSDKFSLFSIVSFPPPKFVLHILGILCTVDHHSFCLYTVPSKAKCIEWYIFSMDCRCRNSSFNESIGMCIECVWNYRYYNQVKSSFTRYSSRPLEGEDCGLHTTGKWTC